MLHVGYSILSFFAEGEDADMASGGNLPLSGSGITPKAKTDMALWGIMAGLDNKTAGTSALPLTPP
jgi:hypothetical protein